MPPTSVSAFVDSLRQSRALDAAQLEAVVKQLQPGCTDVRELAKELVRRRWLTLYQANLLLKGKTAELLLGPYVLLDQLGEGGMGAVFKARHQMMKRTVALKVLRPGGLTGRAIQRFQQEIEAAAALSHPHIVTAHDAGRAGDVFYFAMEHLEGSTLAELVQKKGPLPIASACLYLRQAALGLQHAHEKGLVHRDIKPANLFLVGGPEPRVKVLDLGLARVGGGAEGNGRALTQMGALMGTPDFMAPEQVVSSREVDIRADVYSLGCTLYFLLAGQVPFPKGSLTDKLERQFKAEPRGIRELRPEVPTGLEAVLRKMMAKRPQERYQTPQEVADALAPFCADRAPTAVPVAAVALQPTIAPNHTGTIAEAPALAPAAPPVRRRRWVLPAGVVGLLLLGLGVWLATWSSRPKPPPDERAAAPEPGQAPVEPKGEQTLEPLNFGEPVNVRFDSRWLDALDAKDIPSSERFEWQPKELVAVLGEHRLRGDRLAVRADGKQLALCISEGTEPCFQGRFASIGDIEDLHARHFHSIQASALAYVGEGNVLALAEGPVVRMIEADTGKEVRKLTGPKPDVGLPSLAVSSNGKRIVAGDSTGIVWVWDAVSGLQLQRLSGHDARVYSVAVSADGSRAVSGGGPNDAAVCLWDLEAGKKLDSVSFRTSKVDGSSKVMSVALSADGKQMVSGHSDLSVRQWDVSGSKLKELRQLKGHEWPPIALFSPDGSRFATASYSAKAVCLWDAASGTELRTLRAGPFATNQMAFTPDGKRLQIADGTACPVSIDVETGTERTPARDHRSAVLCVSLSPDGRRIASGEMNSTSTACRLWDLGTAREHFQKGGWGCPGQYVGTAAFTPDGRKAFFTDRATSSIPLHDVETGKVESTSPRADGDTGYLGVAAMSGDGRYVLTNGNKVFLWDLHKPTPVRILTCPGSHLMVSLSPDGRRAVAVHDQSIIYDLVTGKEVGLTPPGHLFFSAGQLAVPTGGDVLRFDVSGDKPQDTGRKIALGSRLSDLLAISRDDSRLAGTADNHRTLCVWDARSGAVVWQWPLPHWLKTEAMALSPDGRYLIAGSNMGVVYVFRLPGPGQAT